MQGTEEPSKILPQIVKAGGKCGFKLFFGLILPSFLSLFILFKLPQLQSCIRQAASHANVFGLFFFLMLLIYFQAKKNIQARKTPKCGVNSE